MVEGYLHVEVLSGQAPKHAGNVCGDVMDVLRTPSATTLILSDGIGSGIKAHLAATLCVSRMKELVAHGQSLRTALAAIVATQEKAKGTPDPYAVISVARILNDGDATIIAYEMPGPILLGPRHAETIPHRPLSLSGTLLREYGCHLTPGEGLLLMTDGVTQAGLGKTLRNGWEVDGVARYANHLLSAGTPFRNLPPAILARAGEINGEAPGDDASILLADCRHGRVLNILTGPPADPLRDHAVVTEFMARNGWKVVCGGTTASIVSRILGRPLQNLPGEEDLMAPPRCRIEGVDLVSEGAVTLNQVFNILDIDPSCFEEDSAVTELHGYLRAADRINFVMGTSGNPVTGHISFQQRGILARRHILPMIAERLRADGKLVVIEYV